ncbi:hypothetical protein Oweho_0699 [Owenweeksia hongkongensis DSM 17368]|uniref:Lipoprotein n=1 Tax=Owenweeksia hongkongensis (strain DSM 17368 / CIP 108786 / JCM 12287 / NRRL B-23963 / UST20020801) TaxID=926562 RepID=G8R1H4_OWEHD|nr:hypothetical protein [Owenweeksia hongkongensis]AEV31713.1 hypothetical protein Oweho_0699 [Owenweeksia hongkongensis DSM 17368]
MTKLLIPLVCFILFSCTHESDKNESLNIELSRLEKNVGIPSVPDQTITERLKAINSRFIKYGTTSSVLVLPEKEVYNQKDTVRVLICYMKHTLKSERYTEIVLNDSIHFTIEDEPKNGIFEFETVDFKSGPNKLKGKVVESILGDTAYYENTILVK